MMLRDYFEPAGQQRALEEYGKFARAKGWDIEEKMRLYRASARAFDPTRPDSEAFDEIYRILCGWQVFRGACMSACWSSRETFDRIRKEFCEFAWGGPVSLLSLAGRWQRRDPSVSTGERQGHQTQRWLPSHGCLKVPSRL